MSAPNLQPISKTVQRLVQRKQHYQQGGGTGVYEVWEVLPPHNAGSLVGRPGPGSGSGCLR